MLIRTIILSLGLLCALVLPVSAQVMIEEGKILIPASGGERVSNTLTVHNTSKDDVSIKVYWEDFQYQAPYDGTKLFLPAGTAPGSASSWVSYSPQEFTLPAFGKKKIDYTVNVPADISGGHYGVLFFEKAAEPLKDQTGVNIVLRTGSLFFIEAKDKNKTAQLKDFKLEGNNLTASFVNEGNVVLIPDMTYYMMDQDGLVTNRGPIKKIYTPPGATAPFEFAMPADIKPGTYTMIINADLEEGDVVVKEIEFTKDAAGQSRVTAVRD